MSLITNLNDTTSTLGLHTNLLVAGNGRPILANIQMDTTLNGVNRNWFFDPTPADDVEFNMLLTRYGSIGGPAQTAGFNGSPPTSLKSVSRAVQQ